LEKLSEIIHRWRQYHFIVRACRQLENRDSYELTDDLGINSDNMPANSGLMHQPAVIVLHHLEVGIEKSNQPGVHNTGATVKISPMICLDSFKDTSQRRHHNVGTDHIPLSNNRSVHDLSSKSCSISLCHLGNSALWIACRHDSVKETNKICQK
jgi:hypothetical protein